jgi:hypothetical protein
MSPGGVMSALAGSCQPWRGHVSPGGVMSDQIDNSPPSCDLLSTSSTTLVQMSKALSPRLTRRTGIGNWQAPRPSSRCPAAHDRLATPRNCTTNSSAKSH